MKILHVTRTHAQIGGIETYVQGLIELLKSHGHKNVLVCRHGQSGVSPFINEHIYHLPSTDTPERSKSYINDIIVSENPDIVYLHAVYDPGIIEFIAKLVPTVGYIHIFYPICPGLGKLFRRRDEVCDRPFGPGCIPMIYLKRCANARHPLNVKRIMKTTKLYLKAYRSLPYVIVGSTYMKRLLIQNGFPPERIEILAPHFVHPVKEPEKTPPGCDRRTILFVGRLEYEKGFPYLLEAMSSIPESYQLFVAGDGSLKEDYTQMTAKLRLSHRVKYLSWLSGKELQAVYRKCCLLVLPSIMPEPFGKVGIEAMYNSRPVVGFDVGGIPDWLQDGFNGFLVRPKDVGQLAAKINLLLEDTRLVSQLGANARKYVEQNYSSERHISQLLHIFAKSTG